jgi:hypothetical protein
MTGPSKNPHNDDKNLNSKSPNDRDKKKSKDEGIDPNAGSMDLEFNNLAPIQLFGSGNNANDPLMLTADTTNTNKDTNNQEEEQVMPHNNNNSIQADDQQGKTNEDKKTNDAEHTDDDYDESYAKNTPPDNKTDDKEDKNLFLTNLHKASASIWSLPIKAVEPVWFSNPDWEGEFPFTPDELDGTKCAYEDSLESDIGIVLDYATDHNDKST